MIIRRLAIIVYDVSFWNLTTIYWLLRCMTLLGILFFFKFHFSLTCRKRKEMNTQDRCTITYSWPGSCSCFFSAQIAPHRTMRWCHCCEWHVSSLWSVIIIIIILHSDHSHQIGRYFSKRFPPTLYGFFLLGTCGCQKLRGCSAFCSRALRKQIKENDHTIEPFCNAPEASVKCT